MARKRNRTKQAKESPKEVPRTKEVSPAAKKNDPWEMIEKENELKSAHEVFFKEAVVEAPKVKHYEKFKNKKKRICDGAEAERVDMHGKGKKRRNNEKEEASGKRQKPEFAVEAEEAVVSNVLGDIFGKKSKSNGVPEVVIVDEVKKTDKKKKKKGAKNVPDTEESVVIVEEPEDAVVVFKKGKKNLSAGDSKKGNKHAGTFPKKDEIRMADLFDDVEGLDEEFSEEELDEELDEELEDEELTDEELFEGLEDEDLDEMEEVEIDADEMRMNPEDIENVVEDARDHEMEEDNEEEEPYGSPINSDDEEEQMEDELDEEEEFEDEECEDEHRRSCCCHDCLHGSDSEQDAMSDEEGNLGEDRVAGVLNQGSKATPLDFDAFPFSDDDSSVTATRALAWIIHNCDVQTFFNDFYQQNVLVVQRNNSDYYGNLFSTKRFADLLDKHYVEYGTNINVAEYKDSVRTTLNGEGRAYPRMIKAHLKQGRSVQLVNPQCFDDHIWYLCEVLQEIFGCFVGANTYLTPAGSAGFAPHWDEIDAFLLQVEGKKYWKVFAPQNESEELPRESSGNFTEEDMKKRKPCFEGWLEAGDMLYIPRGFIHQAYTAKDVHSLHVTVSTGRQWSFADLLDKIMPQAIEYLAVNRLKLRKGLPIGLFDMNGVANCKYKMEEYFTEKFMQPVDRHMSMLRNIVSDQCMPSSVDIMAREFMKTALPPLLTPEERKFSILGSEGEDLLVGNPLDFNAFTYVRFIRRHGQRLIFETEDQMFLAHRYKNSRLYEGREEETIDLPVECEPCLNMLMDNCPEWTKIGDLPLNGGTTEERRILIKALYERGLLLAKTLPMKGGKKNKDKKKKRK